jgi:hypothetical protein
MDDPLVCRGTPVGELTAAPAGREASCGEARPRVAFVESGLAHPSYQAGGVMPWQAPHATYQAARGWPGTSRRPIRRTKRGIPAEGQRARVLFSVHREDVRPAGRPIGSPSCGRPAISGTWSWSACSSPVTASGTATPTPWPLATWPGSSRAALSVRPSATPIFRVRQAAASPARRSDRAPHGSRRRPCAGGRAGASPRAASRAATGNRRRSPW